MWLIHPLSTADGPTRSPAAVTVSMTRRSHSQGQSSIASTRAALAILMSFTQVAEGSWQDTNHMNNTNVSQFNSSGVETKISITLIVVLVPFYTIVSFLVYRRRNRFPFSGLHPGLLLANNFISIMTVIIRCVMWMYWPDNGPPCGLEFLVLQILTVPYILHVLIRGWFLLFKNEITAHLNEIGTKLHERRKSKSKAELQPPLLTSTGGDGSGVGRSSGGSGGGIVIVQQHGKSPHHSPKSSLNMTNKTAFLLPQAKLKELQQARSDSPHRTSETVPATPSINPITTGRGSHSVTDSPMKYQQPSIHDPSPFNTPLITPVLRPTATTAAAAKTPSPPTIPDSVTEDLVLKGTADAALSDTQPSASAGVSEAVEPPSMTVSIRVMEVDQPRPVSILNPPITILSTMEEASKSRSFKSGSAKSTSYKQLASGAPPDATTPPLPPPSAVPPTTTRSNDHIIQLDSSSKSSSSQDLSLLYEGTGGWFVKHRHLMSNKFLTLFYIKNCLLVIGVMTLLTFVDPDTALSGDGDTDTQIHHLFSSPACTVMSIKQWIVRAQLFLTSPIIIVMWYRLRTRSLDAFGLHQFMGISGVVGNLAIIMYSLCLAYAPPLVGIITLIPQFFLFTISDLKPLIESFTVARARRRAFAASSIAARLKTGDTSLTQQLKQFYRLKYVLKHPTAHAAFLDFTRKEFSSENVTFWTEVRHFSKLATELELQLPSWPRLGDDAAHFDPKHHVYVKDEDDTREFDSAGDRSWTCDEDIGEGGSKLGSDSSDDRIYVRTKQPTGFIEPRSPSEAQVVEFHTLKKVTTFAQAPQTAGSARVLPAPLTVPRSPSPTSSAERSLALSSTNADGSTAATSPVNYERDLSGAISSPTPLHPDASPATVTLEPFLPPGSVADSGADSVAQAPLVSPMAIAHVRKGSGADGSGHKRGMSQLQLPTSPITNRGTRSPSGSFSGPISPTDLAYSESKIAQLRQQAIEIRAWGLRLHSQFLAPGAPFEVNVPHDILTDVTRQVGMLEAWHPDETDAGTLPSPPPVALSALYRGSHLCIFDLMQRDSYRRFVISPAFGIFLKDIEKELLADEAKRLEDAVNSMGTVNPHEQLAILDSIEKEVAETKGPERGSFNLSKRLGPTVTVHGTGMSQFVLGGDREADPKAVGEDFGLHTVNESRERESAALRESCLSVAQSVRRNSFSGSQRLPRANTTTPASIQVNTSLNTPARSQQHNRFGSGLIAPRSPQQSPQPNRSPQASPQPSPQIQSTSPHTLQTPPKLPRPTLNITTLRDTSSRSNQASPVGNHSPATATPTAAAAAAVPIPTTPKTPLNEDLAI